MFRPELFMQIGYTEEDVQLGTPAHQPKHYESPGAKLVGSAPGQAEQGQGGDDNGQLVPQTGQQAKAKALARTALLRTGLCPWTGYGAGVVADLMPAPQQHTGGKRLQRSQYRAAGAGMDQRQQ